MTKIARFNGDLPAFAQDAPGTERTVFDAVTQSDDLTDQFTAGFLRGWGVVSSSEFPTREDFNAAFYTATRLVAYLHQMGIAEYNAAQKYYAGSTVTVGGQVYKSRTGTGGTPNVGNEPSSSPTQWAKIFDATDYATQAQAQAGTASNVLMTPQRTTDHFNARTSTLTRTILGRTTAAQIRGDLSVLEAGTGDTQARTNAQNDSRFLQQANYGTSWTASYESVTSSYGRGLVAQTSAANARNTLGLGTMATVTAQTSRTDATDGRGMLVGAGGLLSNSVPIATPSPHGTPQPTSFYRWGVVPSGFESLGNNNTYIHIAGDGGRFGRIFFNEGSSTPRGRIQTGGFSGESSVAELWHDINLPDPARLGQSQTFTGWQSFEYSGALGSPSVNRVFSSTSPNLVSYIRYSTNGVFVGAAGFTQGEDYRVYDASDDVIFSIDSAGNAHVYGNLQVDGTINGGALPNSAGAVGTYAFARRQSFDPRTPFGFTTAGSNLNPADHSGTAVGGSLSGTWRCMGGISANTGTTLWVRIS